MSDAFRFERVETGVFLGGVPLPVEYYPMVPERMADGELWFPPARCFLADPKAHELFLHNEVVFDDCAELSDDRPRIGFMCVDPWEGDGQRRGFLLDIRHVGPENFTVSEVKGEGYTFMDYLPILGLVYLDVDGKICYQGDTSLEERARELVERVDEARAALEEDEEAEDEEGAAEEAQ